MSQASDIIVPRTIPHRKLADLVWSSDGPPLELSGELVVGARVETLDPRLLCSIFAFLEVEGRTAVEWPTLDQITVSAYPVCRTDHGHALGAPAPEADNTPLLLETRADGRVINSVGFTTNPGTFAVDVIVRLKSHEFASAKLFDKLSILVGAEVGISPAAGLLDAVEIIHRVRVSGHERTMVRTVGPIPD